MQESCQEISGLIPQYLAGELLEEENWAMGKHLEACEKCAALSEHYRVLLLEGRNLRSPVSFEAAWQKIGEKVEDSAAAPAGYLAILRHFRIPAAVAFVCIALAVLLFLSRSARVQPAMSVAEMEDALRKAGELDVQQAGATESEIGGAYELLGSSGEDRVLRIAGVSGADEDRYGISLF